MWEVLETDPSHAEKGSCTSRADRRRYWANGLKLLATGYLDTAREKEGATGHVAGFWSGSKTFHKGICQRWCSWITNTQLAESCSGQGDTWERLHNKKAWWKKKPSGHLVHYCAFTRGYHSCFWWMHFPFFYSLPITSWSCFEFPPSPLYLPPPSPNDYLTTALMRATNDVPGHKITQCFKQDPSSLFGNIDLKMGIHTPASTFFYFPVLKYYKFKPSHACPSTFFCSTAKTHC